MDADGLKEESVGCRQMETWFVNERINVMRRSIRKERLQRGLLIDSEIDSKEEASIGLTIEECEFRLCADAGMCCRQR